MRFFILVLISMLFLGCSSTSPIKIEVNKRNQVIANTKKSEIKIDNKRVLFLNTYVGDFENNGFEYFVLSFYLAEEKMPKNLIKSIHVNGKNTNISWKKLEKKDKLLTRVPVQNNWSQNYLVKAPKTEDFNIDIIIETYESEKIRSTYEKDF